MPASILYCTYWYPTIFHKELKPLNYCNDTPTELICDKSKNRYKIQISLDKDENLIISSFYEEDIKGKKQENNFTLELHRTRHHRNGFVQYSFDKNTIPTEHYSEFKTILCKDIYHLAKKFYHQHEVDSGRDGALRGIITSKEGGIDDDDNDFLINFLKDFAPVFESYAKNISFLNRELIEREKRICSIEEKEKETKKKIISKKEYKSKVYEIAQSINESCENACIEYTYCKTLLSSIHNKSFVHNLQIDNEDELKDKKKEWRRHALNIRNSMRYIENIKYKNLNRLNKLAQYLLDYSNGLLEEVKSITTQVSENTLCINAALRQGEIKEKRNTTLALLSIYISVILGLPLSRMFKLDDVDTCLNRWGEWAFYAIYILGLALFLRKILMLQKKSKQQNK